MNQDIERQRRFFSPDPQHVDPQNDHYWRNCPDGLRRSSLYYDVIAINVDGGCLNNGYSDARASYGVYFGTGSEHNQGGRLPFNMLHTSQRSELYATHVGLHVLLSVIGHEWLRERRINNVVIIADSEYMVEGITNWIWDWKLTGWRKSNGHPVENQDLWMALDAQVKDLQNRGLEVMFMHVTRNFNQEADALARSALN